VPYVFSRVPGFVTKAFEIFSDAQHEDICGWGRKGTTIVIHKLKAFELSIVPRYFKHSNFSSFVRQLNLYSFHKTMATVTTVEFYHPYFQRDRHDLLHLVKRKPRNGPGTTGTSSTSSTSANPASKKKHSSDTTEGKNVEGGANAVDLGHSLINEEAPTAEQLERVQMLETAVQDMLRLNYHRKAQLAAATQAALETEAQLDTFTNQAASLFSRLAVTNPDFAVAVATSTMTVPSLGCGVGLVEPCDLSRSSSWEITTRRRGNSLVFDRSRPSSPLSATAYLEAMAGAPPSLYSMPSITKTSWDALWLAETTGYANSSNFSRANDEQDDAHDADEDTRGTRLSGYERHPDPPQYSNARGDRNSRDLVFLF